MDKITTFRGSFWWLSNFSDEGGVHPTVEHQFQARKATTVEDAIYVMAAAIPGDAKCRGRLIKIRDDWEEVKIDVMYELLLEKFAPPAIRRKLLATGDAILVERNHWGDTFWGVCRGEGENWLGQLLMAVREHYQEVL